MGCPFLKLERLGVFFVQEQFRLIKYELLLVAKKNGQLFLIFFNASFLFSELKAFSATMSKTASA